MRSERLVHRVFFSKSRNKDYYAKIDGRTFFDQPVKNYLRIYDNARKITIGQGADYTTGYLLDYPYFDEKHKLIAIDLSKQQVLHADPKGIQQINFKGNLEREINANTTMLFIT